MFGVNYALQKLVTDGGIGHQGWTGTLIMIAPERDLVVAYLTNKLNTPVTDNKEDLNTFNGNWYTASSLGFVPQILFSVYTARAEETGDPRHEDQAAVLQEELDSIVK